MDFQELLSTILLPAIITVVSAVAAWAGRKLVEFLQTRIDLLEHDIARAFANEVLEAATVAVRTVAQVATEDLKAAAADGKLTVEEAQAALALAVRTAWENLSQHAKDRLIGEFGEQGAKKYISTAVEAEVLAVSTLLPKAEPITDDALRESVIKGAHAQLGLR